MKRILSVLVFLIYLFLPEIVIADENFNITANSEYKITTAGVSFVTNNIDIKNKNSSLYSKSFNFQISGQNPKNIKVYENGDLLQFETKTQNDNTEVIINFPKSVIGLDNTRSFLITYEDDSLLKVTSDVKEINIPKLNNPDSFDEYKIKVSAPLAFGEDVYFSVIPRDTVIDAESKSYLFVKEDFKDKGISFIFGRFQTFSFNINFHLENPLKKNSLIEVAIPPDSNLQELYYEDISPKPKNIRVDEDGNWLASFDLKPREKLDIHSRGYVRILAQPRKLPHPSTSTLFKNTIPTQFWQSEDPVIKDIAATLETPEDIYKYVITKLSYNYERVKPNIDRLGAKTAVQEPTDAICMEFTDLFIALARAKGIPARESNGYAYSDNPKLLPLALVADVLHAWPEYWDEQRQMWIAVDPTWEATSGRDYFNHFDLNHFAFVMHGLDPLKPYSAGSYKLGTDPQKDIYILPSELPLGEKNNIKIDYTFRDIIPFVKGKLGVNFKNSGQNALYDITPEIFLSDKQYHTKVITVLTPYSSEKMEINFNYGIFAKDVPDTIKVSAYRKEIEIPINKTKVIIYQILLVFIFIFVIVFAILLKTHKKLRFFRNVYTKIKKTNLFKRNHK